MIEKEIEILKIENIKPYEKNAKRHPKKQIEQIKKSIKEYGYNDPIQIDEKNMILAGHGRYVALKEMGYTEIQVLRITGLNEQQKKAYILVHNKLNMSTGFDNDILIEELEDIIDFDLSEFGFDLDLSLESMFKENERTRTDNKYNLDMVDVSKTVGYYEMPIIKKESFIPTDLIGFNYAKSSKNKNTGIHFYIDDYQFERIWNNKEQYIEI